MKTKIIGLVIALAAVSGFATEGSKIATSVVPQSFADNSSDVKSSTLFVWMGSGAWSNAPQYCSDTRAYIRSEDKNLQAAFLTFWTAGKVITLTIDNSKIIKDGGCQIVAIRAD
jgi:hypothetical protein